MRECIEATQMRRIAAEQRHNAWRRRAAATGATPRDAAPRRRAARDAVQALRAHQHIRHKVGVRAQLPRGRQRQVAWHADAVAHVPQRGGRRAALKRRRAALAAARGAQRVRPALLGVRAHQQRVRHVPQRCHGQGRHR